MLEGINFLHEREICHLDIKPENILVKGEEFRIIDFGFSSKYPFDEDLSGKEDRYWANDQIEKGFKIFYDFEQEVKHHYTPNGATWKGTA